MEIKDVKYVGDPYKHQHSTNPAKTSINLSELYLVSLIISATELKPIFITDDATFGIRHFNQWKIENGYESYIAKVDPIPFIRQINLEMEND